MKGNQVVAFTEDLSLLWFGHHMDSEPLHHVVGLFAVARP